jgi:hypothetical protein
VRLIVAGGLALVIAVAAAVILGRPGTEAATGSGVTVQCSAATGVDADGCRAWGEQILRQEPRTRTFRIDDVVRLSLDRELFGFGDRCRVEYFIGRYPDRPLRSEETPCPG